MLIALHRRGTCNLNESRDSVDSSSTVRNIKHWTTIALACSQVFLRRNDLDLDTDIVLALQ
jgi:hypothetical protein